MDKKIGILLILVITIVFSVMFPSTTHGQTDICGPFYQYGGHFKDQKNNANIMSDIKQEERSYWEYRFNASSPVEDVEKTSEANFNTYTFSQIFMGFYNILGIFTLGTPSDLDSETLDRWQTFCIDRHNKQTGGQLNITTSGVRIKQQVCDQAPNCPIDPVTGLPEATCNCKEVEVGASSPSKNFSFEVPYAGGIREISRKIPSLISNELQYCNTDGSSSCRFGMICVEATKDQLSINPIISSGKDGVCYNDSAVNAGNRPYPANILCYQPPDESFENVPTTLASKACVDTRLRENPPKTPGDSYISAGTLHAPTNTIPFDTDAMEYYYNGAIVDLLGFYTKDEAEWIKSLPARFNLSVPQGEIRGTDDYVERLGGYAFVAEDARRMTVDLIPAGDSIMVDDYGNQAYMRAGDGYHLEGALFVNEKPLGHLLEKTQRYPYISSSGTNSSVVVTSDNQTYAAIGINGTFQPLVNIGPGNNNYPPITLVNSFGDKIVFSKINNEYMYTTSIRGNFTPQQQFNKFSESKSVSNQIRATIDSENVIHILWGSKDDVGDNSRINLYYSQYKFSRPKLNEESILQKTSVQTVNLNTIPDFINGTFGTLMYSNEDIPFSIQTDKYNNALITVRVAPGIEKSYNKLLFTVFKNDTKTFMEPEIVTSTTYPDSAPINNKNGNDGAEFFIFSLNGGNKIAAVPNPLGYIRSDNVMVTYQEITRKIESKVTKDYNAIRYSRRLNGSDWSIPSKWSAEGKTGIPLSETFDPDWNSGASGEGFTRNGIAYFTVDERTSKYNILTKLFDPAGRKRCVVKLGNVAGQSTECGKLTNMYYVIPPTQTQDGKMQLVDPTTKQVISF